MSTNPENDLVEPEAVNFAAVPPPLANPTEAIVEHAIGDILPPDNPLAEVLVPNHEATAQALLATLPPSKKRKYGRKATDASKQPKRMAARDRKLPAFNDMFFQLSLFRLRNGHTRVPSGSKLSEWITRIRVHYQMLQDGESSPILDQDRIDVLNSLGFVWDIRSYDLEERWNRRFEELVAYKKAHGHCNVPQSKSDELSRWVKMQRELYKNRLTGNEKRPHISEERLEKLISIGFNFVLSAPAVGWEQRFKELLQYKEKHGDCNVPQFYPANRSLGRWVGKQRSWMTAKEKGEYSQLTDERIARLNDIGFTWYRGSQKKKVPMMMEDPAPVVDAGTTTTDDINKIIEEAATV